MRFLALFTFLIAAFSFATSANGQQRETPYWASLRAPQVNMRVGPSADYQIDWVYRRAGLPIKVVRLKEGWRLVQDPDGVQGWVVARLLSPQRTAMVVGDGVAPLRAGPNTDARLLWKLEPGVVGVLGDCESDWCEFETAGHRGWVPEARLWGAGEP